MRASHDRTSPPVVEVAHVVGGRARFRLTREVTGSFHVATAFLSSQPGVRAVRGNRGCRSIVVRFDPARTNLDTLLAVLEARLGLGTDRPVSAARINSRLVRAIAPLVFELLAPPGLGLVLDVLAALRITRDALRELRVRAWPRVLLRAVTRLLWECSFVDVVFPARLRLLMRLGRAAFSLRNAVAQVRLPAVTGAPLSTAYAA